MRGFCDPERHLRAGLPLKIRKSRETFPIRTPPPEPPVFSGKKTENAQSEAEFRDMTIQLAIS